MRENSCERLIKCVDWITFSVAEDEIVWTGVLRNLFYAVGISLGVFSTNDSSRTRFCGWCHFDNQDPIALVIPVNSEVAPA